METREGYDMEPEGGDVLLQFIPMIFLSLIYAVIVFIVARKRGINPWPWTIATLVPVLGLIVSGVFFLLTWLSMLDRLSALEKNSAASHF